MQVDAPMKCVISVLIIWMIGNTGVDSMSSFNKSGCDCCDTSRIIIEELCKENFLLL